MADGKIMEFPLPAGCGVEDRVMIAAPAEQVWRVLEGVDAWGSWNPLYVEAAGNLRVGERLAFAVVLAGMKPQRASAVVQTVVPDRFVQYQTSNLGGLIRATRYIALQPTAGEGVEVANGEILSGPIGRLLGRAMGEKVRVGLAGMNAALKIRVENPT